MHALIMNQDPPSGHDIWGASARIFRKSNLQEPDFLGLVEKILQTHGLEVFTMFVGMARKIWLRRNEFVHGGNFTHPNIVYREAMKSIEEFQKARTEEHPTNDAPNIHNQVRWRAPGSGWYKANWDVGIDRENERLGVGIVVRNLEGLVIGVRSITKPGYLILLPLRQWEL